MPGATCPICGLARTCANCVASTAIAQGVPPERGPRASDRDDAPMPSILREYNDSFLRIFLYYMLLAAFTVIAIALGWWLFGW